MSVLFTVLASGSRGNASLLEVNGFGLLLDFGLGPRQLAARLAHAGLSWHAVHIAILTHTHVDHWNERTFCLFLQHRIPVYCHADHSRALCDGSPAFRELRADKLVRKFADEFVVGSRLRCRPIPVRHDAGATFGFRFQGDGDLFSPPWSLGYLADLGCWDDQIVRALVNVDLLAVEFNHDVAMEQSSGRTRGLIARVLSDMGHLSNHQAASLVREVARLSITGRLQRLVQLHLSSECNRPALAIEAARTVLAEQGVAIHVHTAFQDRTSPTFHVCRSYPCLHDEGFRSANETCRDPGTRRWPPVTHA
jgi:phosphoribosyl 1,2-cyclic phosphodiesterase